MTWQSDPRHSPKHICAARKASSIEEAQDNPEPDTQHPAKQIKHSTGKMPAMTQTRTVTSSSNLTGTQFIVCFCRTKNIFRTHFVHLHISEPTPGPLAYRTRQSRAPLTHRAANPHHRNIPPALPEQVLLKILPVCMSNFSSEILPNIHLVFYPTGSRAKKRKCQAATDPVSEQKSSSSSDSSSTVDNSSLGMRTYSNSSDWEPEEASAKNLSKGWSVPSRPHRPPKHPRLHQQPEHHTSSSFSSMTISGN